jgi:hypothetical protein
MSFKIRGSVVFMALFFSSVLVFAASPKQLSFDSEDYSSADVILFGFLGAQLLSPSSR